MSATDFCLFHPHSHIVFVYWPAIRESCRSAHSLSLNEAKDYLRLRLQHRKGERRAHEHDLKLYSIEHIFPSNPLSFLPLSCFLFYQFFPLLFSLSCQTLQPFLPPNPLMALAEKPVWEVHWRIKRTLTSNLEKEVEKMSGGNREVEMREREKKRFRTPGSWRQGKSNCEN